MNKVKIMLTSLAMFAIVGGALAFKARYIVNYCTANPINPNTCPVKCETRINRQVVKTTGTLACTAAVPVSGSCTGVNCGSTPVTIDTDL